MKTKVETTEFLKECLADSLISLVMKEPYQDITISEIAANANVGRATFYRHFTSKEDLIHFKFNLIHKRWLGGISKDISYDRLVLEYIEFLYSHRKFLKLIYAAGLKSVFADSYIRMFKNSSENIYEIYRQAGVAHYFFGMIDQWIVRDFKESPEELKNLMQAIIINNLEPLD